MSLEVAFGSAIEGAARRWELDPRLLAAVAAQETGGPGSNSGRNVVGDGGHGHGLFQIDDRYHAFARTADAMDPSKNADYAAHLLHDLVAQYGGDLPAALNAYNSGSPNATGTLTTWRDGRTLGYADSVERHYADLGEPEQARADVACDVANSGVLASLAGSAPAANVPSTQTSMAAALQEMQQTDADGAQLIGAVFDS